MTAVPLRAAGAVSAGGGQGSRKQRPVPHSAPVPSTKPTTSRVGSIVHDVREVGIVALPESLPDYHSISTLIDDPTRDVAGLALGTRAA